MRRLTIILITLTTLWSSTAEAQVHRIAVSTAGREMFEGTAVAFGRIDGREFLLTNEHLFETGSGKRLPGPFTVTIKTLDAGDFAAMYHGGSDTKGSGGVDLALVSVRSSKTWKSYQLDSKSVPAPGQAVTIEGFPAGRYRSRRSTVLGYFKAWGMSSTGTAQGGESGAAILRDGKLVGLLWGNQVGSTRGTYSTHSLKMATFVRERFAKLYGTTSQTIFDPTLSVTDGRGGAISLRSPIALTIPGGRVAPKCRIEMFSGSRCGPCIAWKRTELAKVRADGIAVEVIENDARARAAGVRSYPTFVIVHVGREQARRSGFASGTRTTALDLIALFKSTHPKTETSSGINAEWKPVVDQPASIVPDSRIGENATAIAGLTTAVGRLTTHVEGIKPTDVSGLLKRIAALEKRKLPEPVDLSAIEKRLQTIEGITLPVRIETSAGKLVREKMLKLVRTEDGRLVFKPIVLRFDEAILRGGVPAKTR